MQQIVVYSIVRRRNYTLVCASWSTQPWLLSTLWDGERTHLSVSRSPLSGVPLCLLSYHVYCRIMFIVVSCLLLHSRWIPSSNRCHCRRRRNHWVSIAIIHAIIPPWMDHHQLSCTSWYYVACLCVAIASVGFVSVFCVAFSQKSVK